MALDIGIAVEEHAGGGLVEDLGADAGYEVGRLRDGEELVFPGAEGFPAEAEVESDAAVQAEVVLEIGDPIGLAEFNAKAVGLAEVAGEAEEGVGGVVAGEGGAEGERAVEAGIDDGDIELAADDIDAQFEGVATVGPGEGGLVLVVGAGEGGVAEEVDGEVAAE